MPFVGASTFLSMVKTFRVVLWEGRYGGGKTSGAFRLAYELLQGGFSRYLLSNCASVWTDDFRQVQLREGRFLDAVLLLDEGGVFLKSTKDAEEFLAFARKLNVVVQIASVFPPNSRLRFLRVQRVMTFQTVGLPLWMYRYYLDYGKDVTEAGTFFWWRPSEIWGVYDTLGTPADAGGLDGWIKHQVERVKRSTGYAPRTVEILGAAGAAVGSAGGPVGAVDELRDAASELEATAREVQKAVSALGSGSKKRRRRH